MYINSSGLSSIHAATELYFLNFGKEKQQSEDNKESNRSKIQVLDKAECVEEEYVINENQYFPCLETRQAFLGAGGSLWNDLVPYTLQAYTEIWRVGCYNRQTREPSSVGAV